LRGHMGVPVHRRLLAGRKVQERMFCIDKTLRPALSFPVQVA
jgi:hypothetical protein